jgi:hypothetical protein
VTRFTLSTFALLLLMPAGFVRPCRSLAAAAARPGAFSTCSGKTPLDIVRHYYRYAAQRNAQGAQACLSAPYRKLLHKENIIDPDWVNIASIRLLHIHQEQVPPKYQPDNLPVPAELFQVVVTYIVHYRVVESQPNGRGVSFVYVAKQTRHSPWRITGIGSGP